MDYLTEGFLFGEYESEEAKSNGVVPVAIPNRVVTNELNVLARHCFFTRFRQLHFTENAYFTML
jgi:hypothetical protein